MNQIQSIEELIETSKYDEQKKLGGILYTPEWLYEK